MVSPSSSSSSKFFEIACSSTDTLPPSSSACSSSSSQSGLQYGLTDLELNKFYYVRADRRSYPLKTLVDLAIETFEAKRPSYVHHFSTPPSIHFSFQLESPQKKLKYAYFSEILPVESVKKNDIIVQKIIKVIKSSTFVDWAASTGQSTCSLSLEEFEEPYILTLNGRTYSKMMIQNCINTFLLNERNLNLEDMTIHPSKISQVYLYPNLTFSGDDRNEATEVISYSHSDLPRKEFDESKAITHDIPGFSEFVGKMPGHIWHPETWNYEKLYNTYADHRKLSHFAGTEQIENLVLSDISFPGRHPKCDSGHLLFQNILFTNCKIDMSCWCGVSVKSSLFKNCEIDLGIFYRQVTMPRTTLINCIIKVKQASTLTKGTYIGIERVPGGVNLIRNIVDDSSRLSNCTLVVE